MMGPAAMKYRRGQPSVLGFMVVAGAVTSASTGCDVSTALYWATDYGSDHEGSVLSLPLSLFSAAKYAPGVPRIVFAINATGAAWEEGAVILGAGASGPLCCHAVHVAYTSVPDDRLERLIAFVSDPNATTTPDATEVRRKEGTTHPLEAPRRQDLSGHAKGDNLRFYAYPALGRLGVKYALYLDVDCFAVAPLHPFFAALRTPGVTFVVAHTLQSSRPLSYTKFAREVNYTKGSDEFNAGVLGANVEAAVKLDVPASLAEVYALHVSTDGPLWPDNSVNQAALILVAKQVRTLALNESWNCKYLESPDCRIFHKKPKKWPSLAHDEGFGPLRDETSALFADYFGTPRGSDSWEHVLETRRHAAHPSRHK